MYKNRKKIYQSPTENYQYEKLINIKLIQIVVTCNDPGEPPSFDSNHMRTSDIADASDTVGQDFDRSDISIHEAQPALRRTARVSKV
jgi:hypothetical protein